VAGTSAPPKSSLSSLWPIQPGASTRLAFEAMFECREVSLLRRLSQPLHDHADPRVADPSEEPFVHSLVLDLASDAGAAGLGKRARSHDTFPPSVLWRRDPEMREQAEQRLDVPLLRFDDIDEGTNFSEGFDNLAVGRARFVIVVESLSQRLDGLCIRTYETPLSPSIRRTAAGGWNVRRVVHDPLARNRRHYARSRELGAITTYEVHRRR
jgi:hypothetical protein